MIRAVAKELHAAPSSDNKHEQHTTVTSTMNTKHLQPPRSAQRQSQKKGYQQWIMAICVTAFVVLILSRNQDGQNLSLSFESTDTESSPATEQETVQRKIRQISILGERNSGTRWTYEYVPFRTLWLLKNPCILLLLLEGPVFPVGALKLTLSPPNLLSTAIFQSVSAMP
jgi:hypothetical protein